jgi:hypothetical protein
MIEVCLKENLELDETVVVLAKLGVAPCITRIGGWLSRATCLGQAVLQGTVPLWKSRQQS